MNGAGMSPSMEWRAHWPLVLACFMGMSFPSTAYYALGLFFQPLTQEFGWNRTQISAGASLSSLVIVVLSPFIGALVDRWGVRRIALPGVVLTAMGMASFGLTGGSYSYWLAAWSGFAVASALLKSTIWTIAISGRFETARSMALAVAMSGASLGTAIVPPLMRWMIDAFGWREAWALLAFGWGLPVLAMCALFLFDVHDDARRSAVADRAAAHTRPDLPGLSIGEAIKSVVVWRIGLATLITLMLSNALILHKVPILVEAGMTRESAAWLASLSGIAGFVGSLGTGWLMDRFDAGRIGFLTNTVAGLSLIPLLEPFRTPTLIVLSMLAVGFAGGAKLGLCAYMTGRYAGLRNYGKIFGVMASIIASAGAVGALIGGLAYDYAGSYDLLIAAAIPASLISAVLIVGLGPYPDWSRSAAPGAVNGSARR